MQGRFLRTHVATPHRTLVLKQRRPQVRQGGGLLGTALPRDARSVKACQKYPKIKGQNESSILLTFGKYCIKS